MASCHIHVQVGTAGLHRGQLRTFEFVTMTVIQNSKRTKRKPTFACSGAASFLLLFLCQRIEELLQAEIRPDPADVMNHFTQRTFYPGALLDLLHTAGTERVITR